MNKNKKIYIIFMLLSVFLVFSCDRTDFNVDTVLSQPYITTDGVYGLSLYMIPSVGTKDIVSLQLYSPDNNLSWNLMPMEEKFGNLTYVGSSSAVMPKGSVLPQGEWKFIITSKDGRTVEQHFAVSYKDAEGALERNEGTTETIYDIISNLTVIPMEEK